MIHKDFQCEFYFIRHGESTSNATPGFAAGVDFDSPLTSKGLEQARLLGQRLKAEDVRFDRVYSSSLTRAVQTTETMLQAMGEADRDFPQGGRDNRAADPRMERRSDERGTHD